MHFQKVLRQYRNVVSALAQRRQLNLDGVESKQEILAKPSLGHFSMQVSIRRRQQTHIHLLRLRRSDSLKITRLQHTQQLRLQVQRYVSNLVEKQRTAVRELETSDTIALRISKRTTHVSKQFAFENTFRKSTSVQRNQRLRAARRYRVKDAGDHLFTSTVLAGDEHVGVRWSNALDEIQHCLHRRRLRNDLRYVTRRIRDAVTQRDVFCFESTPTAQSFGELHLRAQHCDQTRVVPGLLDEVACASPHRFDGQIDAPPRGHHHHRQRRIDRTNAAQQIKTFAAGCGVTRIIQIDEDDVEFLRVDRFEHAFRRRRAFDLKALTFE